MIKYFPIKKIHRYFIFSFILVLFFSMSLTFTKASAKGNNEEVKIPEIAMASLEHYPFVEGNSNKFFIASKKYSGQVQYQLFYNCKTTMDSKWKLVNNKYTVKGWTRSVSGNMPIIFDISDLKLKADYYRFAIRIRRVGERGKYSNEYGDYDYAFPFALNVVKNSNIDLNSEMLIEKFQYTRNEKLIIDGVKNNSQNSQYKLHLYDVKNNRWLTELTQYKNKIEYNLRKIPQGIYVVDIWAKESNSSSKYDGWKLKIINVNSEESDEIYDKDKGNTSGNILNLGMVAEKDDWIYYADHSQRGKLYKMKNDGSSKIKLSDNKALYINVIDEWIYYCNISDNKKIYKVKTDGSCTTKISDDSAEQITVRDGWIYYLNATATYKMYKIRTDGTNKTKLNNDISLNINLEDQYIYYTNVSDSNKIYRIKIDGTERTKLIDDKSGFLNVDHGYIYYSNISDNSKIYKAEINGRYKKKLSDRWAMFINVREGWIYYSNIREDSHVYRMKTDGSYNEKIVDSSAVFNNVVNGYIYFESLDDNYDLRHIQITN